MNKSFCTDCNGGGMSLQITILKVYLVLTITDFCLKTYSRVPARLKNIYETAL